MPIGVPLTWTSLTLLCTPMPDRVHVFRVKTGSWTTSFPEGHLRIGISRGMPRFGVGKGFRLYRKLNPGPWFNRVETAEYLERYQTEILGRLDPAQTLTEIEGLARGQIPVLCCYERVGSGQWCHRALAAQWFFKSLGIRVPEVAHEGLPQEQHPMLPPEQKHAGRSGFGRSIC